MNIIPVQVQDVKVFLEGETVTLWCDLIQSLDTLVWRRENDVIARYDGVVDSSKDFILNVDISRSMTSLKKQEGNYDDSGNYTCVQYPTESSKPAEMHTIIILIQGVVGSLPSKLNFKYRIQSFIVCSYHFH